MILSPHQDIALRAVMTALRSGRRHVSLEGYAGTGKTTIAHRFIAGGAELLAPTGKAAARLREKTGMEVKTIHSRIASIEEDRVENGRDVVQFRVNAAAAPFDGLVIVDEGSMVDKELGDMLDSKVLRSSQVLWIQDPFQLPPIKGDPFIDFAPSAVLTEVHRQAAGSPVMSYATEIRSGRRESFDGWGGDPASGVFCRLARATITATAAASMRLRSKGVHTILLCHTNAARSGLNLECRRIFGAAGSMAPLVGEPIVCCHNMKTGPMNGEIFTVASARRRDRRSLAVEFAEHPGTEFLICPGHMTYRRRVSPMRDWYQLWGGKRNVPPNAMMCDFGYALTVHKSQGSEWDTVIHLAESWAGGEPDRLHYTAVTRAARGYLGVVPP